MTSSLFITSVTAATSSQPQAPPLYLRQCLDAAAAISCSVIRRYVINWPITTQLTLGRWHRRQQAYQWCRMNENFVHVTAAMSRHPQIVFRCQQ